MAKNLNVNVKMTNALDNVSPLSADKTEELLDDSSTATAEECAGAAKACMAVSDFYKDAAQRLNREALDRATSFGYTCDMSQAKLSPKGELLMWKTDDPSIKVWVKVFPNTDWFNVKKANALVRSLFVEGLQALLAANPNHEAAKHCLDAYSKSNIFKLNPEWNYKEMNNSKVNNSVIPFVKDCETQNLYDSWTLFDTRSDEIRETDIREYDGQQSLFSVDLTFII